MFESLAEVLKSSRKPAPSRKLLVTRFTAYTEKDKILQCDQSKGVKVKFYPQNKFPHLPIFGEGARKAFDGDRITVRVSIEPHDSRA